MPVTTEVVPVTLAMVHALLAGDDVFASRYGVAVARGYLDFPDVLPVVRDTLGAGMAPEWFSHLILDRETLTVVGFGGYKGPPVDGEVEIGYSVAPDFRRRGHASAAVDQLVARARARGIQVVSANTLAEANASTRLLERAGFARTEVLHDEELGGVWRWELRLDV